MIDLSKDWERGWYGPFKRRFDRVLRTRLLEHGYVEPFYVAAWGLSRCYGGPEEGGWWYDDLQHLEVRKVYTVAQGLRVARELRRRYPTCPRGRHSVLGGQDVRIRCYASLDDLPQETDTRPTYE